MSIQGVAHGALLLCIVRARLYTFLFCEITFGLACRFDGSLGFLRVFTLLFHMWAHLLGGPEELPHVNCPRASLRNSCANSHPQSPRCRQQSTSFSTQRHNACLLHNSMQKIILRQCEHRNASQRPKGYPPPLLHKAPPPLPHPQAWQHPPPCQAPAPSNLQEQTIPG